MSSDRLYREIASSYRQLLSDSSTESPLPSLRNYCRLHHVNYADFVLWALLSKAAGILPEIFSKETGNWRSGSKSDVSTRRSSPFEKTLQDTVLYPVEFTSCVEPAEPSPQNPGELLSGVHIRFADGTTVYIQQASAREISSIINTCKP